MGATPVGGTWWATKFAPVGGDDVLRLDIDYETGRTALRWLPDRAVAEYITTGQKPTGIDWAPDAA